MILVHTLEMINFLLLVNDILRSDRDFRLQTGLLLLCERDIRCAYLGTLETCCELSTIKPVPVQPRKWRDRDQGQRTVFLSFRSAASCALYASPISLHLFGHTPGFSSEPSQQLVSTCTARQLKRSQQTSRMMEQRAYHITRR